MKKIPFWAYYLSMEILKTNQHHLLLEYFPRIRLNQQDWLMIGASLEEGPDIGISAEKMANKFSKLFKKMEGLIYISSNRELVMLVMVGQARSLENIIGEIKYNLPIDLCDVDVEHSMSNGIPRIDFKIYPLNSRRDGRYFLERMVRRKNIIMIADDDVFIREFVVCGMRNLGEVVKVSAGDEVYRSYAVYNPDIVFLDIHLPGQDGREVLETLFTVDKDAYTIMVSADSSLENVRETSHKGAKGFLAKPFSVERLSYFTGKCPTIF
ncbi:MAG: response regulator [Alphaproteobacteria bacterium]|nr:response regulator [Alphaproteobacteria bacterium]